MAQQLSPLEQFLSNKLANEFRYVGSQIGKGNIPYGGKPRFSPEQMRGLTAPGLGNTPMPGSSGAPLNGIQTGKYGPTDWNPSANPLAAPPAPSLPPAERAYQQEASRVAQLTAQDPELQRYEKARSAAKTQEEMNAARDIGMQIWQQKYGNTPMGQPGGAVGSFNPLMQKTFGYQAGMSPNQIAQTITNPADIPVAPGEAPYQTGDFGTRVGVTGYDPVKYGITPEMIEQLKAQSLAQARK